MSNLVAVEDRWPEGVTVEWNLGRRCNFDCSYCGANLHDHHSRHLPLDKALAFISKVRMAFPDKAIRLSLTGGEPFVHPRIIDILRAMKEHDFKVVVTTNGSAGIQHYRSASAYLSMLIISAHMERPDVEPRIRALLPVLMDIPGGPKVQVTVMMSPGKFAECERFMDWVRSMGASATPRRIRPLRNPKTGRHNQPGESGMLGQHQHDDTGYYSDAEIEWLKRHAGDLT